MKIIHLIIIDMSLHNYGEYGWISLYKSN